MSEQRPSERPAEELRTLVAVVRASAMVSLIALIADLAQLDGLITSGGPAVIRVAAYVVGVAGVVVAVGERFRRGRRIVSGVVATLSTVVVVAVTFAWPAPGPEPTVSRASGRTLAEWAAAINQLCGEHAAQAGRSFNQIRIAGSQIVAVSKKYEIATAARAEHYLDELERPIKDAFPAASTVDTTYTAINHRAASVDRPTDPAADKDTRAWLSRYGERADTFSDVYASLANYIAASDSYIRATFLVSLFLNVNAYNRMTPDVLNEGKQLGVRSCP